MALLGELLFVIFCLAGLSALTACSPILSQNEDLRGVVSSTFLSNVTALVVTMKANAYNEPVGHLLWDFTVSDQCTSIILDKIRYF